MAINSAIVCLTPQRHETGVKFVVESNLPHVPTSVTVCWQLPVSEAINKTYGNARQTTDFGAMAIALLLMPSLTEFTDFEVSKTGDGVDFWLSKEDELSLSGGLEVLGIRRKIRQNSAN